MRPSLDAVMLSIACLLSTRATCRKRQVGCVLVDSRGRILSTGYNGTPRGLNHCTEFPCSGANMPAGSDTCEAVHAELNAIAECHDTTRVHTCYVSTLPCNNCAKTLMNTGVQVVVYLNDHAHSAQVLGLLKRGGISVRKYDEKDVAEDIFVCACRVRAN